MTAGTTEPGHPAGLAGLAGLAVETTELGKRYGRHVALDGAHLAVPAGSVYGLVGPNGAGKTTLLAVLAGLRRPSSGRVRLGTARAKVALLPDTPQFDPWLTGREVVSLAAHLTAPHLPPDRVDDVLGTAGLGTAADRRVGGYSRGMLQRLGLRPPSSANPGSCCSTNRPRPSTRPAGATSSTSSRTCAGTPR